MPVIKVYAPSPSAGPALAPAALQDFGQAVAEACVTLLEAHPDKVQCVVVEAEILAGAALYIEVLYRDQPSRDARMAQFMQCLSEAASRVWGRAPRIRCMPLDGARLHALG